jgi:hypothetical protein
MNEQRPDLAVLTRLDLYFSVRQFTRTMRCFAELFDRDYDMVMIFFIVAESCFQSIIPLGGSGADMETIERIYLDSTSLGLSLFIIGEASGIPRETVRRKVKALADMGYLATLEKNKNIYVPISAFLKSEMLEAFKSYASEIDQFVRTAQYYSKSAG